MCGPELVDALAKRGVTSFVSSPVSLRPPDVGFDQQGWTSLCTVEQDEFLLSRIKEATPLTPILPLAAKKPWIFSHTLHLIHVFRNTTFSDTRA